MRITILSAALICASSSLLSKPEVKKPERLPDAYKLLYSQEFKNKDAITQFLFSDPKQWNLSEKKGDLFLECTQKSSYRPKVRSPYTITLIKDRQFGDFVLKANLLQTGKEYGHRDMCIFFNFEAPDKYYYIHVATKSDPHAHNIMIVNGKPRVSISKTTTKGIKWGEEKWHTIKLVRDTAKGTIEFYFDDMKKPIMTADDTTFKNGHIGFGTFDDSGCVDDIKIWGKTAAKKKSPFFKTKASKE